MYWTSSCKKHLKIIINHIISTGHFYMGYTDGADKRFRCNYPGCKTKPTYEVFYGGVMEEVK